MTVLEQSVGKTLMAGDSAENEAGGILRMQSADHKGGARCFLLCSASSGVLH